jgi:predicted Zn-ribbon and HTH transcriptional regulator
MVMIMAVKKVEVDAGVCERCGHTWILRDGKLPKTCPNLKCKSPYWNLPRGQPKGPKKKE